MNNYNQFTPKGKIQNAPSNYIITNPLGSGLRVIVNFVSQLVKFDDVLDLTLGRVWRKVKEDYFLWGYDLRSFKLGNIKDTLVNSDIIVVNLLVKDKNNIIDAVALESALVKLQKFVKLEKASIHISNLLTKDVPALQDLVERHCVNNGINCYFYSIPAIKGERILI